MVRSDHVTVQFKPGSKEMAAFLEAGYGMSVQKAQTIIKEREENPAAWPYEVYEKALAMLEAWKAKPEAVSTRKAWRVGNRR